MQDASGDAQGWGAAAVDPNDESGVESQGHPTPDLGDCGYFGIALPENLMAYSIAVRGRRHAYRRMAMSLVR